MVLGRGTAQLAAENSVFPLRRKSPLSQELLPIGTRVGAGIRKELDFCPTGTWAQYLLRLGLRGLLGFSLWEAAVALRLDVRV